VTKASLNAMLRRRGPLLGIAAAAGIAAIVLARQPSSSTTSSSSASAPTRLAWPSGKEQVYALAWSAETESNAISGMLASQGEGADKGQTQAPMKTQVALEGELVLASFGAPSAGSGGTSSGGDTLLLARFEKLSRVEVRAVEQSLVPSLDAARGELEGHSAELVIKPNGEISDVRFRANDPALFRYLMQALATELVLDLREGSAWTSEIDGPSGRGPVKFSRDKDKPLVITRTRERYSQLAAWPMGSLPQQLASGGQITLRDDGVLEQIRDDESLEAARPGQRRDISSKTKLALTHKAERAFDAQKPPEGYDQTMIPPEGAAETEEQRKARLERRTEGVTLAAVVGDIRLHAAVPKMSGRWAWVAEGYFQLHPEKCGELVEQMKGWDVASKAVAVDLLMNADTEASQSALVRAFKENVIAPGIEWAYLAQRLGQVQRPTVAFATWVSTAYADAKRKNGGANDVARRRGLALALGGVVYHLSNTDRALARKLDDPLVIDLYATKDPLEREALLLALGNAALEEDASAIRLYAREDQPYVRAAAATALRRLDSGEIRGTLLALFADKELDVQRQALGSLDRRDLTQDELAKMRAVVDDDKLAHDNAPLLVNFLSKHRSGGAEIDAILDALAKHEELGAETLSRIDRVRRGT
jgi:hypothetical protein